jgi:ribonuclease J
MYEWTRPRIGIPVHGEAAHLVAHGALMAQSGIPEVAQVRNGDMIRLAPGAAEIIDKVPFGRIYKDGRLVGDDEATGIRERRKLSFAGHVAVNVVLDEKYEMAGDPDLVAIGVATVDTRGADMEELMLAAAIGAIESIPRQRRKDLDLVQEAVRRAVRGFANDVWGKKPLVTVFVTR